MQPAKTGTTITTFPLNNFFAADPGFQSSDPRVIYDAISGRWFATFVQFPASASSSSIILAVSTTSDPTGTFCRYRIGNPTAETFFQDFPMLGVSDDKVVVSYNGFNGAGAFIGAGFYALNKADLTTCAPLRAVRFAPNASWFTPHPAQSLTSTTDLLMAMHASTGALTVMTVSGVPGVTAVTATSAALPIRAWTPPPAAVPRGSAVLLDTGDDRAVKSTTDTLLTGSRAVPALAPGASSSGTVRVTIPTTTAAGTYFLLACADGTHVVVESNEANNCRASVGKTVVGP